MGLYLHALLRTDEQAPAVDVAREVHAFFLDLAQLRQGEHLESAAVRQYRLVPVHELVQSAHLVYHIVPRAEVQMVGIAQLHLCLESLEVNGGYAALYRGGGPYVHEKRRFYRAVRSCE